MQTAELATVVAGEIERGLPPSKSHALPELMEHVAVEPHTYDTLRRYAEHGDDPQWKADALFTCGLIAEKWENKSHLTLVR